MRDLLTSNAETVSTSEDVDQTLHSNLPKTWINPQQPIAVSELVHLIPKELQPEQTNSKVEEDQNKTDSPIKNNE